MADVTMPQLGETVTEGTIIRWLKQVGEEVDLDEVLFEVSTDKVDTEVPSPAAGVVSAILAAEGEEVEVGQVIARIGSAEPDATEAASAPSAPAEPVLPVVPAADVVSPPSAPPAPVAAPPAWPAAGAPSPVTEPPPTPPTPPAETQPPATPAAPPAETPTADPPRRSGAGDLVLSPVVRRLISENDIDIEALTGSGLGGRITRADVERAIRERLSAAASAVPARPQDQPGRAHPAATHPQEASSAPAVPSPPRQASSADASTRSAAAVASPPAAAPMADASATAIGAPLATAPAPVAPGSVAPEPAPPAASASVAPEPVASVAPEPAASVAPEPAPASPVVPTASAPPATSARATGASPESAPSRRVPEAASEAVGAVEEAVPGEPEAVARQAVSSALARRDDRVVELNRIRRRTADHMLTSKQTSPHVLTAMEVDFEAVEMVRRAHGQAWRAAEGFSLTYLPFVARAVVDALRDYPNLNASLDGEQLHVHQAVNLAVAVDLDFEGLLAPVISNADGKRLRQIARDVVDLSSRARSRQLAPDELVGGTFTLTNAGQYGTLLQFPIINQPQVAILSTDGVSRKPVVAQDAHGNESIAIHSVGVLAMAWDHRAFDGAYAAAFLHRVREILETRDWKAEIR